jgi:hypothetical protein
MRKLTDYQKKFLLEQFFKNEKYAGWKGIATHLLEQGRCVVAGDKCIWIGGIGNFIKTTDKKGFIDCIEYTFDLEAFLKSEWFRTTKQVELDTLLIAKKEIEKEYDEIAYFLK